MELLNCPFCGGKGSMLKSYDPDGAGAFHFIQCGTCRAKGAEFYAVETCPIFYGQVRDAWNTRAAMQPTPQEPRCAKCGHPKSNHPYRHPFVAISEDSHE